MSYNWAAELVLRGNTVIDCWPVFANIKQEKFSVICEMDKFKARHLTFPLLFDSMFNIDKFNKEVKNG